jgi:multidrug resistance protein, MATE family
MLRAGASWQEITIARIKAFCELYVPTALSVSSDFWRVAVIGVVAAQFGDVDIAVYNAGYRIMWLVLTLTAALSVAAGIKTGQRLGGMDSQGAKQAGWVGIYLSVAVLCVTGTIVAWRIRWFGRVFSDDREFLDLFEEVRWPFTLTLVLMNLSIALESILCRLGRNREVFWYGFVASWGAQAPCVILLTSYWRKDLVGLYWGMSFGYTTLAVLYAWMLICCDWKHFSILARQRSEVPIT